MAQNVYPDKPANPGVRNALLRAQQLLKLRWTPVAPYPAVYLFGHSRGGKTYKDFLDPYRPHTGVGYSAVGYTNEKYVGLNVTLETYMTAMANPKSVLYTCPVQDRGKLSAAFYGTVCSGLASYVLGFPFHFDCPQFSKMEEMEHIDATVLENLQLCDLLNDPKLHTAVITGIDRDENGNVVSITVTESTPPQVISTVFLPEEFTAFWLKDYDVLRYKKLHTVTYTPNPWVKLDGDPETERPIPNPVLLPDYGDKANYRLGEAVTLSVFDCSYTKILLLYHGQETVMPVDETGDVRFTPEESGDYQAVAVGPEGKSRPVEFCVTEAAIVTDKAHYQSSEPVKLTFTCPAGDELTGFMVKTAQSAKYWGYIAENGKLPDTVQLPAGDYYILAHYRNRYGVYTATPTEVFHVEENCYVGSAD